MFVNWKNTVLWANGIVWACLGFVAGIALVSWGNWQEKVFWLAALFLGAWAFAAWKGRSWRAGILAFAFFAPFLFLGIWHMDARTKEFFAFPSAGYFAQVYTGEVEVHGYVGDVRKETERNLQVRIDAKELYASKSPRGEEITGSILAFAPLGTRVAVGEYVAVRAKLTQPQPIETFDYPRYLASQGIGAVMFRAHIAALPSPAQSDIARTILAGIARMRVHAREILARYVGGVEGEVLIASSLGYPLSRDTQQLFSRAGVTHLVAISGMNIALVMSILSGVFITWGLRRQKSILLSLAGIVLFVFLVGLGASVVRAAIMGVILYAGSIVGRPLSMLRLLLYAASLMLFFNPFLLFGDVGFQLSFAAIGGIVLCAPYFDMQLSHIGAPAKDMDWYTRNTTLQTSALWRLVRQTTALSLAAILFTAPLGAYHFGVFSVVGIALNIIAVPLFPFVLILAFCAIALGSVMVPLGAPLAWVAWFLIFLLKEAAMFTDALPISSITFAAGQAWVLLGGYAFVAGFMIWLIRKGYNPLTASMRLFHET